MFICICQAVTDTEIHDAINNGANTIVDLQEKLNVGITCGKCTDYVENYLELNTIK